MYTYPNLYQQQPVDERIWVQSEASAEAYLIAPNSFVRLWDSTKPVFYEKRADASGRPYPIEAYEYTRREPQKAIESNDSIKAYDDKMKAIEERISALEEALKHESKSFIDDARI